MKADRPFLVSRRGRLDSVLCRDGAGEVRVLLAHEHLSGFNVDPIESITNGVPLSRRRTTVLTAMPIH